MPDVNPKTYPDKPCCPYCDWWNQFNCDGEPNEYD